MTAIEQIEGVMPREDKISLVDTHCHIHDSEFTEKFKGVSADDLVDNAKKMGVERLVCVGTDVVSSKQASEFCRSRNNCFASVALHPHEAEEKSSAALHSDMQEISSLVDEKTVAIGETGLDYFYHDDPKTHKKQEELLRLHIDLAQKHGLPMIFHIRDPKNQDQEQLGRAFAHFFRIIDEYENITGVIHSFSAGVKEVEGSIKRGFYIGLNGIMTFTGSGYQLDAARAVPVEKLVLETDAPFLTPSPFRGTMCEPKHVRVTAEFLSELRGESLEELARQTTANAQSLLRI